MPVSRSSARPAHWTPTRQLVSRGIAVFGLLCAGLASAQTTYDLADLERLARETSPALQAAREQVRVAESAVNTAAAFPNPEVEYLRGSLKSRAGGVNAGNTDSVSVTQPLDLLQRFPRIGAAEAGLAASRAGYRAAEAEWLARLRTRYFEVLRRESELRNATEDLKLIQGVNARIRARVETGDAARFELIKSEAEMLNVQKNVQAAGARVANARSQLRQAIGAALPEDFVVAGQLPGVPALPPIEEIRDGLSEQNPNLARARAEVERAERLLAYEKAQRLPSLAVKASQTSDPEIRSTMGGLVVSVPLWDRRKGPVGEASAQLARAKSELRDQEFSIARSLDIAYQQYQIAQAQVTALEGGIVRQAEAALKVAEAAYRFGERGFIEVLDAQRVYRAARAELTIARYELATAWVEFEKLRAQSGESQ